MPHFVFGPSGGTGGNSGVTDSDVPVLEEPLNTNTRVIQVEVRGGEFVDAIQFTHLRNNDTTLLTLAQHGGPGGHEQRLDINREEHITKISGRYGDFVDSITIETDKGQKLEAGGAGGLGDYTYEAPPDFEIVGFYGRSGEFVDAVGVVLRKIP